MVACVLIIWEPLLLLSRLAESWSDHGKKDHTRKVVLLYEEDVAFTSLSLSVGLPVPLNMDC